MRSLGGEGKRVNKKTKKMGLPRRKQEGKRGDKKRGIDAYAAAYSIGARAASQDCQGVNHGTSGRPADHTYES